MHESRARLQHAISIVIENWFRIQKLWIIAQIASADILILHQVNSLNKSPRSAFSTKNGTTACNSHEILYSWIGFDAWLWLQILDFW